jgi:tellurite resistance protein TerC
MLAQIDVHPALWAIFIASIVFFLALDLGVFHRRAHVVSFKEALRWTLVWFSCAMIFAASMLPLFGVEPAVQFLTGYIIELSLSMDNVFVIAVIFTYFRVPPQYQHRVLFWGILGALVMRGVMIGAGVALIERFHWLLYVLGAFLIYSGFHMMFSAETGVHPEKNPVIRLARRLYPVSGELDGQRFLTHWRGRRALTPLALVLLMVETTDLVFALDSIPAIFAVTLEPFIIFTSNVFAILGLRSLYFVLAGAIRYFRYLKVGLSVVLVFIGVKMLSALWGWKLSTLLSLGVVAVIITGSIAFSVVAASREKRAARGAGTT